MSIIENVKMALSSLRAHKMRSFLTMLGIIIGVASVIAIVAIGQGGEAMLKSTLVGEGNTIELYYMPSEEELQSNPSAWMMSPFTPQDIQALENIPEVSQVVTISSEYANARYREERAESSVTGINQAYLDVLKLDIEQGRNFLSSDFIAGQRVAIISHSLEEELFDGEKAIGEVIYINSQPLEIIGILEEPGGIFSFGINEVYIPWKTWRTIFGKSEYSQVLLQTENVDDLHTAGKKAADLMNRMHDTEGYQVLNMEEIAEGIGKITTIMTIIISSIAGVSLLVGGIGVMNIMLVSVTERTREIGIRMSLGATRGQILFQFLVESVTLTLIGGLIGMLLGTGAASLVSYFAGWPSLVSLPVIIGGILFSMLIGVVFGILPANKAASLDPIESLRYE